MILSMLVFFLITWLNIRISLSGCCSWSARLWKRAYFYATWYRENNCLKGLISEKNFVYKEKHFWIIRNTTVQYLQQNFQKYFLKIRILIAQNVIPKQNRAPGKMKKSWSWKTSSQELLCYNYLYYKYDGAIFGLI